MPVAWIVAPVLFAAGYLTCRQLHRRPSYTPVESAHDAVQDAARTAQHLHATVRQLEDQLANFQKELQTTDSSPSPDSGCDTTSHPLFNRAEGLISQLNTTRAELHEHIRRLINAADLRFDPATGLGSQREANRWMETLLALMARYGNHFSIAIAAIDRRENQAELNEEQTNCQLNELGNLLRRATRETDILARYSEDELLVILPETNESGAVVMAQRVRAQVAKELDFSISIGVASALSGDSYKTLIHRADAALFTAQDRVGQASGCRHTGLDFEVLPFPCDAPTDNDRSIVDDAASSKSADESELLVGP